VRTLLAVAGLAVGSAQGFAPRSAGTSSTGIAAVPAAFSTSSSRSPPPLHMSDYDGGASFDSSQIEEIEFKIYPDGRIEETVRGVKGENCHEVTEAINSMLGKTTASKPTEEMYETEIEISNTVQERAGGGTSSSSDSGWEGSSSW